MNAFSPDMVNSTRFREAREEDWQRLDDIVTRIEKHSIKTLSEDELLALPVLYRQALSSLSLARETALDAALIAYLEQLCTRAYFQIYGVSQSFWKQAAAFFRTGWPDAVRAIWPETLVSVALMALGALLGFVLVTSDPAWFYGMIPETLAGGRTPEATTDFLRGTLYNDGSGEGMLATFATYLFTHNTQVSIFAFALGFAFGVPTALLITYNGLMLGAIYAVYAKAGLAVELTGWLMIHGTTELFAIALAGAAGFRIGRAVAFPGRRDRLDAAVKAGKVAGTAMAGVVVMLLLAGLLEGIGRETITSDAARFAIAGSMLAFWILYFYLWPARRRGR